MKKKAKLLVAVILIVLISLIVLYSIKDFSAAINSEETVKIGALLALTGDAAFYGSDELKAIQIAVDEKNKEGGINGRKIELIVEDIGTLDTPLAISALRKLVDFDNVKVIIGPTWDMPGVALAAEEEKVVLISPDNTEGTEVGNDLKYFYSTWAPQRAEAAAMTKFIIQRDYEDIIIFRDSDIYAKTVTDIFTDTAKNSVNIIDTHVVLTGEKDFRTDLIKIKEKQPDAIFLTFASETLVGPFLKQVKELGLEVDVLGTVGAENGLSGHTDYAEVTLFYTYPKITKEQLDLLEKFELKYDVEPQVPAYANAYDAANIVITALNSGASNPDEIRNYFDNNKFKSVTFGTLKFDEKGYVSVDSVDYIIKTVKDGKFIEL